MELSAFPSTCHYLPVALVEQGGKTLPLREFTGRYHALLGREHCRVVESSAFFVVGWTWVRVLVLLLPRCMTWISSLSSPSLSFLICKTRIIVFPSQMFGR